MDPVKKTDRSLISGLPDNVLIEIISNLSVKKATATSLLSRRWRNLYRQLKKIVIREYEFVNLERVSFFNRMLEWVSRFSVGVIESFVLVILNPKGFEASVNSLITFAVSRKVKKMELDFTGPDPHRLGLSVPLPDCFYNQTNIESLSLYACDIESSRFKNSSALRSLTIGNLTISEITTLLSKFPSLERLQFFYCMSDDLVEDIGESQSMLRELTFFHCNFNDTLCVLSIPNATIFSYSGEAPCFYFTRVNDQIQQVYLNFDVATTYTFGQGEDFAYFVESLSYAKTLTVSSYLLQMIQNAKDVGLQRRFDIRHLVMEVCLHPNEFRGIRYFIDNSPELESLTLELLPPRTIEGREFELRKYWLYKISHECLEKTLKVVEVKGFSGDMFELYLLQYLIRYGRVMERLNLYVKNAQRDDDNVLRGTRIVQQIKRASSCLQIAIIHNDD